MVKFLKSIFKHSNFLPLVIVIFFALLAGRYLLQPGYFNMHDDLQMMRQLELEKCFLDGQIPCRWVPDMGYGFGFPLFNFYPPLPYLIGQVFRVLQFSFVDTVKITFLLSFIISGITMYFLSKEFFGKWGGVISSIFYIWAPYHSVDIFVRGAMNEAWALCWFPLILFASYKLIKEKKNIFKFTILLSISWFLLFTSHNLMVLIFTPVFGLWCLIFILKEKSWKKIINLLISGIFALGLSAFFTLPAIFEQKYVQVNTLVVGYYEYIAHFATLNQLLFSRFWGYGPSVWLENDGMPFQVGHLHWILSIIILLFVIYMYSKKQNKKKVFDKQLLIVSFFILIGWIATFMTHLKSSFIWKVIPPLKFVQFPWRFLTLTTFSFSFIAGYLAIFFKNKVYRIVIPVLVALLILLNWNYFKPEKGKMGPLTDKEKFSAAAWELQQTAGIYDYLPVGAKQAPQEPQKHLVEVMEGGASYSKDMLGTNWASFDINVKTDEALIRIGIFKFPNWKAYIDGKETEIFIDKNEMWGRMYIRVPKGEHSINLKLYNTPIRTVSNLITLVSWLALIILLILKRRSSCPICKILKK
jgi:hypothetical protein